MKISEDFKEFFELLNRNNVNYLLIGGYAYSIHAEPRYTKDVDIFYERKNENAGKLLRTIKEFGFGSLDLTVEDFMKAERIIQLGVPPLRIDLLNDIEGITFEEAWQNKIESTYGDQPIYVLSKADLIKNKKASGREQDLLDVKELEKY